MPSELLSLGNVLALVAAIAWSWLVFVLLVALVGGLLEEWDIAPPRDGGGR